MYHFFRAKTVDALDLAAIEQHYREGFVFTRLGNTVMHQVRSVRVSLQDFEPTSENRRILGKFENLEINCYPLGKASYHWRVGKMAQDFYRLKFGPGTVSANKIRQLCTDIKHSSMNAMYAYQFTDQAVPAGYCIAFRTPTLIHYAYPFHALPTLQPSIGIAMMTKAVVCARGQGMKYIYLGSIQGEKSLYKFQFKGVEWFDGNSWRREKPVFPLQ